MRNYEICDLHGHFLPGIDDGSGSVEESLKMLESAQEQGIAMMFATPHYYSNESVTDFLHRRNKSMTQLQEAMARQGGRYPEICLGAEVAYRRGIGNAEELEKLCLGCSGYLLLEMPFAPWDRAVFQDLSSMINVRGIVPVIAHIERYLHMQKREQIERLLGQDVLVQMNASMLLSWSTRGKARRLLESGIVHLLGSDCHNMQNRAPNMGAALDYLEKKGLNGIIRRVAADSMTIYREAVTEQSV